MVGPDPLVERAKTALLAKAEVCGASDCWNWRGASKGNGYGHTSRGTAHRRSYELFVAPVPKGMDVCHHCDNRACINPAHLFVGSRLENMRDAKLKGRLSTGASHPVRRGESSRFAKLTEQQAREIRSSTLPSKMLAERYGVSSDNINRIRRNETWKEC